MLSATAPDLIFENARLVDGTGAAPHYAEVAVIADRICALAPKFSDSYKAGARRVDLRGHVLAPGFVDVHAHGELEPLVDNSAAGKVASGVTSEISGNCGLSPFPLMGPLREQYEREARDEFGWPASSMNWTSAAEYLERLEQARCTINRGFLVGHGSLRAAINGYADGPAAATVRARMVQALEDCLAAGCFGMSTGLIYPPGCFAGEDEIIELARICGRRGALYATHMRSESDQIEESIDETLRLCRVAEVRTQISHLKITARRNWRKLDWLQQRLERAKAEGFDFHADRYPYIATSTGLDSVLPNWTYAGGRDEELKRLQDPATAARIEQEILARNPAPEYWSNIQVASATDAALCQQIAGRRIADIAAEWKLTPFETLRQILVKDVLRTSAVMFSMPEDQVERILAWPFVMVGSDATARNISGPTRVAAPHPRTFGTFPRVLAKYVRERKVLTLEEAVRRMTSLPAETFHIRDRGVIREGAFADLVVFDAESVTDQATYADPNRFPNGIEQVYVNGVLVVQKGSVLDARPGRVLRHDG